MNRPEIIKLLANQLKASDHTNELNHALTHSSYTDGGSDNDNSRYVFLGQFAFRGYVAEIIYNFAPGTGTQLQHILGNIFKNEHLLTIYNHFKLEKLIRYGDKFDHKTHRHIFVFGLLGFIYKFCSDETKVAFVRRHFILPNKHLFNTEMHGSDLLGQCNVIARMLFQETVFVETLKTEDNAWKTTVMVNTYEIATETSVSYRYSQQKTLKKALKQLAEDLEFIEKGNPDFEARRSRIEEIQSAQYQQQKEEKKRLQAEKEARKRTENILKKEKRKADKEKKDELRRKAKADIKKKKESRKGKDTIYREYSAEEIATMNPAKRRRLEDLGILAKQR